MAQHQYELGQYTYIDVKVASPFPDLPERVLKGADIKGMEFVGQVGELPDHLLYRIPKNEVSQSAGGQVQQSDEEKNSKIVTAISAVQGVVHVEIQVPHQRIKRDEL
ncbi:hypothetical protein BGW41_002585 [Actinomortierella wolfii]|nr:hypothetical protein BGW41_002585 [Actinomortierella wolfii]